MIFKYKNKDFYVFVNYNCKCYCKNSHSVHTKANVL